MAKTKLLSKLIIITIPAYNEEQLLGECISVLRSINIEGFKIEILIVDDGSKDSTFEIAKQFGADYVFKNTKNLGLARTFQICLERAILAGADFIVNFDADIQYDPKYINTLLQPLINSNADIVIGERNFDDIKSFSPLKRNLQRLGSYVVSKTSGINCRDCTSGFRAYTRKAASELVVSGRYTYTLETLYLSSFLKHCVISKRISTTKYFRPSRLLKSNSGYIIRSLRDIFVYLSSFKPMRLYFIVALFPFIFGILLGIRYINFHIQSPTPLLTGSYFPSLILSSSLLLFSIIIIISGSMSEAILANRRLAIESRSRQLLLIKVKNKR